MTDDIELPKLPGEWVLHTVHPDDYRYGHIFGYRAEDMQLYARSAVLADRERRAQGAISERLKDRAVVHANMMRGVIARLSNDQFIHLIGEDLDKLRELQKAVETVIAAHSAGKGEA